MAPAPHRLMLPASLHCVQEGSITGPAGGLRGPVGNAAARGRFGRAREAGTLRIITAAAGGVDLLPLTDRGSFIPPR